jgi:hypothetical protein
MTDGDSQCIGGVVRCRPRRKPQEHLDHVLDLMLLGASISDDGSLDLRGCVLHHGTSCLDRRQDGDAAGVPKLQGTMNIGRVEKALNRHVVRTAFVHQRG